MNAVPFKQPDITLPVISFALESFDKQRITARVKQLYERSVFRAFLTVLDAPID